MGFEYFLAKRYAFSREKENFITIISVLSMLGITVGTAALITVLSVFNGFSSLVTDLLLVFDPHVRITAASTPTDSTSESSSRTFITDYRPVVQQVGPLAKANSISPVVQGKCVLVRFVVPRVVQLIGLDPKNAAAIPGFRKSIVAGELTLDPNSIIVGQTLAQELSLTIDDTLEVISPVGLEKILTEPVAPKTKRLRVAAIFAANNREYDAMNSYTNIETARELFEIPPTGATSIDLRIPKVDQAIPTSRKLAKALDTSKYEVKSWYDLHTELYSIMEMERWVAYIILFLIVAVACFNIFSSLTLTVFEKHKDIALLRALGTSEAGIRRIYLLQGSLVGVVGTIAGLLVGLVLVWTQDTYGWYSLQTQAYIVPAIPVELRWTDFCFVALGSIGLATVGALLPARRAARVRPAQSLRYE